MATQIQESAHSLRVILDIAWKGYGARYAGRVTLLLNAESVSVSFEGTAVEEFDSNRIGLVVLHRPDDAGRPVTVGAPDGSRTNAAFPTHISPHQPFKNIAALEWERNRIAYRLDFHGDTFETEDQRNWTDASFKTYSTPLSIPFPVTHHSGDTVRQSIRLSARQIVRVLDRTNGSVPALGTSAGGYTSTSPGLPDPLPGQLAPLLAEVAMKADPAQGLLAAAEAADMAERLNVSLDARIVAGTPDETAAVLQTLPPGRVARLGVYDKTSHVTEHHLWDTLTREAKKLGFSGQLIAGVRSHFTELNRNPHSARKDADAITYSITPQMHATELNAVIESLTMQTLTVEDALRISNGRSLHIGPVTLVPRFNAVATRKPLGEELPTCDTLQRTPFAAAWLLGSVTALTRPGTASISYGTLFELSSPAGKLLIQLAAQQGRGVLATDTAPETAAIYPVRTPGGTLAFAANLTAETLAVRIIGPTGTHQDLSLGPWQTDAVLLP